MSPQLYPLGHLQTPGKKKIKNTDLILCAMADRPLAKQMLSLPPQSWAIATLRPSASWLLMQCAGG